MTYDDVQDVNFSHNLLMKKMYHLQIKNKTVMVNFDFDAQVMPTPVNPYPAMTWASFLPLAEKDRMRDR